MSTPQNTNINTESIIRPFAKEQTADIIIKCFLFLMSPFLAFFYSLRTMDRKSSYVFFFLFAVFWCMIQCPPTDDPVTDMSKNRIFFERIAEGGELSLPEIWIMSDMGKAFYSFGFLYLISLFTSNYHWFVVISGCLISFFQLKCFRFFTSCPSFTNGFKALVLAGMFAMHAPLYWCGAIRWILAAWIAVYATLQIWMNKDKRYWILLILPPLIHFSFFVYVFVFYIANLTKKRIEVWGILLIFSFGFQFLATILYDNLLAMKGILPQFIFGNMGDQAFMDEQKERIEGLNTAARLINLYLVPYFPTVLAFFFYANRSVIKKTSTVAYTIFQVSLVLTFFYNVFSVIPDLGRRLGFVIYIYYSIVMVYCFLKNKYAWVYYAYIFSLSVLYYGDIRGKWLLMNELTDWVTNPFTLINNYLIHPIL